MQNSRMAYFSDSDLEVLREKAFELLEKNGVKMDHPEVLKLLDEAGAFVDFDSKRVRFSKRFLEEQIAEAPKALTLVGRNGKHKLKLPREDGTFHTRTNTGAQSWLEPETGTYRRIDLSDVATWARLASKLEEIGFCAFPVPSDVPSATADVHALRAMLQNTEKHIWVQPYTSGTVEHLVQLSIAAAGGATAMRANPLVSFITCSLTPLEFKHMDLEIILQCARHGIPLQPCSLPGAGATAPITEPGVALLSAVEILAMLAAAQVIQPGTPIVATPLIFSTDMSTGRSLQSSVESIRGAALAVQFIKSAFGIPTHTYGIGTDSPDMDGQCMSEGALRAMLIGLSGADILGAAGQMEVATTISPVQLVIDNEVLGMVRRLLSDMTFDGDTMAWEDLLHVEPGAQFLTSGHTLRHCRDALVPINFTRLTRQSWAQKAQGGLVARATEFCKNILEGAEPVTLDKNVKKEMDSIVTRADMNLA